MSGSGRTGRIVALLALLAAVLVVGYVLLNGGSSYTVHARFQNAAQLVKGNLVQVSGVSIGKVTSIDLSPDGEADVTLKIDDASYTPLRRGTRARRRSRVSPTATSTCSSRPATPATRPRSTTAA